MEVKGHEIPINLLSLIAIYFRLPNNHEKSATINNEITNYYSGYKGELANDYFIQFIDRDDMLILHDLRLPFMKSFYQIDTLILTSYFFLIIEIKNLSNFIRFNHEKGDMYQQTDLEKRTFQDPILQADAQVHQFKSFLYQLGLTNVHVETLVSFVNQNATLAEERDPRIIYGYQLKQKFDELLNKYPGIKVNQQKLEFLSNTLIKKNRPLHSDMMKKQGIKAHDLTYGILCPTCLKLSSKRQQSKWICSFCRESVRSYFMRTFIEYALIFDNTITNKKARKMLGINSSDAMQKIFQRSRFDYFGEKGNRVYQLNFDFQKDSAYLIDYYLRLKNLN
ncbi:nuclease-related domain-containing protein [Tenuibacillus multivorans]|uniref:Nuclease-related domain-containing protein n=1 Tax=Tenuibacillus multivorans TaxID=237069 RepID=A0A1H0BX51_9BACI|nr:nuclease-related domain-containing protein [Tenuibacillus multivorans]GEL78558.1 nuclease [Tenuibacillus multivorans]SDN50269.1 Nuclease-related domain-containing protein [Tenuibacillus multivorans]